MQTEGGMGHSMAFTKVLLIAFISLKVKGQSNLAILTDPPTNGSIHYFCGNGGESNFTITCNFSSSVFTPDVVINGVRSPVSDLSDPYTVVAVTESMVVIRFLLSSAQNMYNFSCVFSDTEASTTITLEEDFNQCVDPVNTSTDSPPNSTGTPISTSTSNTQVPSTSQVPLPSQTPGSNASGTTISNNDPLVTAVVTVVVVVVVIDIVMTVVGISLTFWFCRKKKAVGRHGNDGSGEAQGIGEGVIVHENVLAIQLEEQPQSQDVNEVANSEQQVVARQPDHPSNEEANSEEQPTCTNAAAEQVVEGNGALQRPRTEGGRDSDERLNRPIPESTSVVDPSRSNLVFPSSTPLSKTPSPPAANHSEDSSE